VAVKVISDVHGEYNALARELEPDDTAVMLGDYINLLDFRNLGGILSEVFTREEIMEALSLLARGRKELARHQIREVTGGTPEKLRRVRELVGESYREFFDSVPCKSFMLYGNTDDPGLMREAAGDNVEIIEAGVISVEGERFGLVSGLPHGPWTVGLPGEVEPEEYARRVESLGPVDVLCTHYPPAVPELTWDILADRDEEGSEKLLEYIDRCRPTCHYFGHVHNPRVSSFTRGQTRLVNAGFFKGNQTTLIHRP